MSGKSGSYRVTGQRIATTDWREVTTAVTETVSATARDGLSHGVACGVIEGEMYQSANLPRISAGTAEDLSQETLLRDTTGTS